MQPLTISQLQRDLVWADVRSETLPADSSLLFRVFPEDETLPTIDFLMNDDAQGIQQLGSGEWHCHPQDIGRAIDMARKLIGHELCILEERNKSGGYIKSGPVGPNEVFGTLRLNAGFLIRRFFGQPPITEQIDFGKYLKGKHHFTSRAHRAEIEAAYTKVGREAPPL